MSLERDASDGTNRREMLLQALASPFLGHVLQRIEIDDEGVRHSPAQEDVLAGINCARETCEDFEIVIDESFNYIEGFVKEFLGLPVESLEQIFLTQTPLGLGPTAIELAKQQAVRIVLHQRNLLGNVTMLIHSSEWPVIRRNALLQETAALRSRLQLRDDRSHVHTLISQMLAGLLEKKMQESNLDDPS